MDSQYVNMTFRIDFINNSIITFDDFANIITINFGYSILF